MPLFVIVEESVTALPATADVGVTAPAVKFTVCKMFTVVLVAEDVPPGPVHVIEYAVVVDGETVTESDAALFVLKFVPVHDVAWDDDQVIVELCPTAMLEGLALMLLTVGGNR